MIEFDELQSLDTTRAELLKNIKHTIYNYLVKNNLSNGVSVVVKNNGIILRCSNPLDDNVIKCFEDCFSLSLCKVTDTRVENFCKDDYYTGFFRSVEYLFKSSGGFF